MRYRRVTQAGGTYFFTINLQDRRQSLLTEKFDVLRDAINKTKQTQAFHLDAMVVLPEHMHLMMTLPEGDDRYAIRISSIKGNFSRNIPKFEEVSKSRQKKSERGIWQRRFWEHLIRDDRDYENHMNYIHYNPVKHGLVVNARDWKYSTLHRYIEDGVLPVDWGSGFDAVDIPYGERS